MFIIPHKHNKHINPPENPRLIVLLNTVRKISVIILHLHYMLIVLLDPIRVAVHETVAVQI